MLGDIPVLDLVAFSYGRWDNDVLPGRVVARARDPLRFVRHAMFKQDYVGCDLDREELPPPHKPRERARRWKAMQQF